MTEEKLKEIAYISWQAAANAYRMYPKNKHTFGEFWRGNEDKLKEYLIDDVFTLPWPKCKADETFINDQKRGECSICGKTFKINNL